MSGAQKARWQWREHLTDEERQTLENADAARAEWERLNALRPRIVNRAIQRAKYAATRRALADSEQAQGGRGQRDSEEGKDGA